MLDKSFAITRDLVPSSYFSENLPLDVTLIHMARATFTHQDTELWKSVIHKKATFKIVHVYMQLDFLKIDLNIEYFMSLCDILVQGPCQSPLL